MTRTGSLGRFWPFMWLSTLWVGISVALSTGGHPATAVLPLAAWIAHRRTEKRKFGRVNKCVRNSKDHCRGTSPSHAANSRPL